MSRDIEHPDVTHAMRTGYDRETWRNIQDAKPTESAPRDYYGDIIDLDDHYVVIPTGYKILQQPINTHAIGSMTEGEEDYEEDE